MNRKIIIDIISYILIYYKNNSLLDDFDKYYNNGKIELSRRVKKDVMWSFSEYNYFYDDGSPMISFTLKESKLCGELKFYYRNGNIMAKRTFADICPKLELYNKSGEIIDSPTVLYDDELVIRPIEMLFVMNMYMEHISEFLPYLSNEMLKELFYYNNDVDIITQSLKVPELVDDKIIMVPFKEATEKYLVTNL